MALPYTPSQTGFEMKRKASFSQLAGGDSSPMSAAAYPRAIPGEHSKDFRGERDEKKEKMWELMATYMGNDKDAIERSIAHHVEYTLACTRFSFHSSSAYRAAALAVRDRLLEAFNDTAQYFTDKDVKRGYYLSLEFLLGRLFQNALVGLNLEDQFKAALADFGFKLEDLFEKECDPGLGNGGLGRLAACFLDSMATLNLPCWGYGIRYTYGIFEQEVVNGRQQEKPDFWLSHLNPWEIPRPDVTYGVRFYGDVQRKGDGRCDWRGGEVVCAVAYDNLVPGFDTFNCISLRLWKAEPAKEFDFRAFNAGNYDEAVIARQRAENISACLYPNDNTSQGKELRLRQQYFFVCATLQDILRRFKKRVNYNWNELPDKVAIQLNDTHPALAIPELMRLLIDIEGLKWDHAWDLTRRSINYTNHTVLPEALEKWSCGMLSHLLPRHKLLIDDINMHFLSQVAAKWGWESPAIAKMSIYEEGEDQKVRMANLSVIGSTHVNGVAAIHTEIVKKDIFSDFYHWFSQHGGPEGKNKFVNMTNGVTPRRWIHMANRELSDLISRWLGTDEWLKDLSQVSGLVNHKDNPQLQKAWAKVKYDNKVRLAQWVKKHCNIEFDPTALFDVQVKRMHEYKRQLMNALYIIHRYQTIKDMPHHEREKVQKRCVMVGGKAAPGYYIAKHIIKLISNIAAVVNNDSDTNKYLKVAFLPNYNVSNAQVIIPASDISEHISTAGTEASGTSNMKFVMNGGLIIGTMDGANVEIREEGGDETMFIFGAREEEVSKIREKARNGNYPIDHRLKRVFDAIYSGQFSRNESDAHSEFCGLVDRLKMNGDGHNGDFYLVCHDFPSFVDAQNRVDETYRNEKKWWSLSIQAAASMGKFSTDRTIQQYADVIWKLPAAERPNPQKAPMAMVRKESGASPLAKANGGAPKLAVPKHSSSTGEKA